MLVLSRKKNETVECDVLDENGHKTGICVSVTIVEIRGDKVRLGLTAPEVVNILRGEIADALRMQELNQNPTSELQEVPV